MVYINILLLAFIIINITDISGVVNHIEDAIAKWLKVKQVHIHILECSYCQIWWIGLFYLIFTGSLTLFNIAYVLLIAYLDDCINGILILIKQMITKVITIINKIIF